MKKPFKAKRIILILGILLIAAALALSAFLFLPKKQSNAESEAAIAAMEEIIPYYGTDYQITGLGRDPLAAISIDGIDIVGGLDIPSLDLRAPVAEEGVDKAYFATLDHGSPVKGEFRIRGGRYDVFSRLTKAKPGDKVSFTDVDGVQYDYTVTTQFHKKNWDDAEYDLMLLYEVDKDTSFVLACTKEQ